MSIVTRAAQVDFISDILREPHTLRLYVNEDLPDEPTAGDFEEPDGHGYVPRPMRAQVWDLSRAPDEAVYPKQTFAFTGPAGIVRGYYVTRNSDGRLRWFDSLSGGPQRIVNDGDEINVFVSFGVASEVAPED